MQPIKLDSEVPMILIVGYVSLSIQIRIIWYNQAMQTLNMQYAGSRV